MKEISAVLLAIGVMVVLYFGYIHVVGKTMGTNPDANPVQTDAQAKDSELLEKQQKLAAEEIREQQRRLMEERKTRLRDNRR